MAYVSRGEKELRKDWPFTSGTGADDKHEGRQLNLTPTKNSHVLKRMKKGIE